MITNKIGIPMIYKSIAVEAEDCRADMAGAKVLRGNPAARVSRVSKDSRTTERGDLYIALRGENFDGNSFAGAAAARRASRPSRSQKKFRSSTRRPAARAARTRTRFSGRAAASPAR